MRRFVLEADKLALNAKSDDRPPEFVVEEGDVYNIDIMLSTGAGSVKEKGTRPTGLLALSLQSLDFFDF